MTEKNNKQTQETIEIRPGEFETLHPNAVKQYGEHAGFFHSLGRAIGGTKVNNQFLRANQQK